MAKKILHSAILALLFSTLAFSQNFPKSVGYVNDFADILSPNIETELKVKLTDYEQKTSIEIAVVTVKSLENYPIEVYTDSLAGIWGVGKKDKDNGIVFLVAPNERTARISVGYGIEPDLTDGAAGSLLDKFAIPNFKKGDYELGITQTVGGIIGHLKDTPFQARLEERRIAIEKARQERELAAKNFKNGLMMAGIFLAIALPIAGLLWLGIRYVQRVEQLKALDEANKKKAEELNSRFSSSNLSTKDIIEALDRLKLNNPESVWGKLNRRVESFYDLTTKARADLGAITDPKKYNGWKSSKFVASVLRIVEPFVDDVCSLKGDIEAKINAVADAKEKSLNTLQSLPAKIMVARQNANHGDVRKTTMGELDKLNSEINKIDGTVNKNDNRDWLIFSNLVSGFLLSLRKINGQIVDDKERAIRARTQGPKLYKNMPGFITDAEKVISDSAVGQEAKNLLGSAKEEFERGKRHLDSGWPVAFPFLVAAASLLSQAKNQAKNDKERERRRRIRSSSYRSSSSGSYGRSSSSSGSSGGGFGGGSFGGGGSNRSW